MICIGRRGCAHAGRTRTRCFTLLIAVVVAAWPGSACIAGAAVRAAAAEPVAGPADDRAPAPARRLIEITQVLPTYAALAGGAGRVVMPGVHSTRRIEYDLVADRTVSIRLALAEPLVVYSRPGDGQTPPRMALTFDDGPSAVYTSQIMDIFARHGGRGTFFVMGGLVNRRKDLIERLALEGHEVGIHTWWHANLTELSDDAIVSDLARCRAALDPLMQRPVRWVRPPYGAVDARVRRVVTNAGYHVAMWSIDPRDWQRPGSSVIARRILNNARDGAVVVLHDGGGNRAGTVAAMRTVVPALIERGFELVTMSELAGFADPPPTERGMVLTIDDHRFVVENDFEDMRVLVDGMEVELGTPPVRTEGQFLVHGRPVLRALGATVNWDAEHLAVGFTAARGQFDVRLDTLQVTRDGAQLFVRVPSVYYHKLGLLPVWLIANACNATVEVDEQARTISFFTTQAANLGRTPPRPAGGLALRGLDGMSVCGVPAEAWMQTGLAILGVHAAVLI